MKKINHSRSKQHMPNQDKKTKRPQSKYSSGNKPENSGYNQLPNQTNGKHPQNKIYQYPTGKYNNNGNSYHESRVYYRNHQDLPPFSRAKSREEQLKQSIPLLKERLINIQQHYEQLIQEEKSKNIQRSQVILGLIDEMQVIHKEKVASIKKAIQQSEEQNKDMGEVDGKMYEIKGNIDDLIAQSKALKTKNEQLQHKIESKGQVIRQKQAQLEQINKELLECRNQVQQFQLSTLKNNKINREITELFNSTNSFN